MSDELLLFDIEARQRLIDEDRRRVERITREYQAHQRAIKVAIDSAMHQVTAPWRALAAHLRSQNGGVS